ncbi:MAG: hypothetical protein D6717_03915 [Gammaproteobacteria bacterium]|nr:MAG: hypothetical protein D6717_03915 [Gammaproteobacteria bacterium]
MNRISLIGLCAALIWSLTAMAGDTTDEIRAMWQRYMQAEQAWQQTLEQLVVARHPELKEISELNRKMQERFLEVRRHRFEYLLKHDPQRITVSQDVNEFSNFYWTSLDDQALAQADPEYARLLRQAKQLRKRYVFNADKDAYRRAVKKIKSDDAYGQAQQRRLAALKQVSSDLGDFLARGLVARR